jgi:hypothetical protein
MREELGRRVRLYRALRQSSVHTDTGCFALATKLLGSKLGHDKEC